MSLASPAEVTWEDCGSLKLSELQDWFKERFPDYNYAPEFADIIREIKENKDKKTLTPLEALCAGTFISLLR